MSKLSNEDIIKLSDLAKIEITDAERTEFLSDINNILSHLSLVGDAPVSDLENEFYFSNNVRADIETDRFFDRDAIFQNIPVKSEDDFVKVSKVIKK